MTWQVSQIKSHLHRTGAQKSTTCCYETEPYSNRLNFAKIHLGCELRPDLANGIESNEERNLFDPYFNIPKEGLKHTMSCNVKEADDICLVVEMCAQEKSRCNTLEKRLFSSFCAIDSLRSSGRSRCKISWCCTNVQTS